MPCPELVWCFGLPASGKSTHARTLAERWRAEGRETVLLDGDDLRLGVSRDLGFSDKDRTEHIRRTAEVARLLSQQGFHVVAALVTPRRHQRALVRSILAGAMVSFVWMRRPLADCRRHDPKGLYSRAASGDIRQVTGWDSPFEEPFGNELDSVQVVDFPG